MIDTFLARAADPADTVFERAAALNVAARLTGAPLPDWQDPPDGWRWVGGELVRTAPSRLPALRCHPVIRVEPDEDENDDRPAQPVAPRPSPMRAKPPSPGTASGVVFGLVTRPQGATLEELVAESNLPVTSIRGIISIYARGLAKFDRRIDRYAPIEAP